MKRAVVPSSLQAAARAVAALLALRACAAAPASSPSFAGVRRRGLRSASGSNFGSGVLKGAEYRSKLDERRLQSWAQKLFDEYFNPASPPPQGPPPTTKQPTPNPTTKRPTTQPTPNPTKQPTPNPTPNPTPYPTPRPTPNPTRPPTSPPTEAPTQSPTRISPLEPSPECKSGYFCLQTRDWGVENKTKYKIDLSLEVMNVSNADAYIAAKDKWESVVKGDLPSFPGTGVSNPNYDCDRGQPPTVDDLHVCGRDLEIDGRGKVLGYAGPVYGRRDKTTNLLTTITGRMAFDFEDIPFMVENDMWDGVILHEIAHVIGVGTLWRHNVNGAVTANLTYVGPKGVEVWRDWGCPDAPPVEKDGSAGTRGGHWDEGCLDHELMTGYAERGKVMPLSKLTIASLADQGYEVDYAAADAYDGNDVKAVDEACCPNATGGSHAVNFLDPSEGGTTVVKPPLSEEGLAAAEAYGLDVLKASEMPPNLVEPVEGLEYLAHRVVTVLFIEGMHVHDVMVAI